MGLLYEIALTFVPGIGGVLGKKLISHCGSAESIFKEPGKSLRRIPRISERLVSSISGKDILLRAEKEMRFIERYRIKPVFYLHKEYPSRLKNCIDSPLMLYYKGTADLNMPKIIGFVGTRNATAYGKEICHNLITDLADDNVLVISGLAYGIDSHAHRSALEKGLETIGVLGHGLDRIYPFQNRKLAEKMITRGGLLTDFPSGTKPDRENFPMRNRIIAGMSDAIVVVEAATKGGALITADIANSYNRDVFSVPGRIGDPCSEGCNALIRMNKAALVQSAADIRYMMGWTEERSHGIRQQRKIFLEMTKEEEKVVDQLNLNGELTIDEIMTGTGLATSKCSAALLNLEFEGIVRSLPGKVYTLC